MIEWHGELPEFDPVAMAIIEICHNNVHDAEHDVEDGLLISLTRKEIWLLVMSLLLISESAPCLSDDCATLLERVAELVDTQKQHWRDPKAG